MRHATAEGVPHLARVGGGWKGAGRQLSRAKGTKAQAAVAAGPPLTRPAHHPVVGCTHRKCAHATASQPVSMTNRRALRRATTRMRTCIGAWHRGAGLGSRTASLGWRIGTAHWADYLGIARSAQSRTRVWGRAGANGASIRHWPRLLMGQSASYRFARLVVSHISQHAAGGRGVASSCTQRFRADRPCLPGRKAAPGCHAGYGGAGKG